MLASRLHVRKPPDIAPLLWLDAINTEGAAPDMSSPAPAFRMPSDDACYNALAAKDARFDGRFFVGVTSTGIYCRAVCTAKLPRRENCRFFESAAVAEAAGFRPCLKCRPELAPGVPVHYQNDRLARRAADMIRSGRHGGRIAAIAADIRISERQLRRLFESVYGITPVRYRGTCRLLLAKSLLTDTDLPVARIAYSCGFSSLRQFNDAFQHWYRLSPSGFRKHPAHGADSGGAPGGGAVGGSGSGTGAIVTHLGYRPPYRFDVLCTFLGARAIEGVETVSGGAYARTLRCDADGGGTQRTGWIQVEDIAEKNRLRLTFSSGLADVLPLVLAKTKRLFDTDCLPDAVDMGLSDFHARAGDAFHIPGIRLPGCADGFEMAVRAILGQQITVKAANTLAGRVAREFGSQIETPFDGLSTVFPQPEDFCAPDAEERLGALGVIRQRSHAICALAHSLRSGEIVLEPGADTPDMRGKLLALPGIGEWTLQYLLMRAYNDPDALPSTDYAVKQAFPGASRAEIEAAAEQWRPWRSYAVISLWSAPHGLPHDAPRDLPHDAPHAKHSMHSQEKGRDDVLQG